MASAVVDRQQGTCWLVPNRVLYDNCSLDRGGEPFMSAKHLVALDRMTGQTTFYVSLLTISSASGELKSLGVSDGIAYHSFRVTIDGSILADAALSGTISGSARSNTGLAIGLRFEQSLMVEVSGSVLSPQTTYWVVASTDSSEPINRTEDVQFIDGAPYRYEHLTYRDAQGSEYQVTVAMGLDRISRIILDNNVPFSVNQIVASIELRSGVGAFLAEPFVPLVLRINGSRRNHRIRSGGEIFTLTNVNGSARFVLPPNWLAETLASLDLSFVSREFPGISPVLNSPYLEISTDLPGYANYPASFELW